MGAWWIAAAMALAPFGMADPAAAQAVTSPDSVRACLCQERSVSTLNDQVKAENGAYEEKRRAFEALDKQVQTGRSQVNVKNQADVDAFKQMLERRDAAADTLAGPATKSYAEAVERYNRAVSEYNGSCAGKAFDPDQLAEMRRDLSCPKP